MSLGPMRKRNTPYSSSPYSAAAPPPPPPPPGDYAGPRHRKEGRRLAILVAAAVAIVVGVLCYLVIPGGSSNSASVSALAGADLGQAVSRLSQLGYGGSDNLTDGGSGSAADCTKHSTGAAKQFLAKNPCQAYEVATVKAHKRGISTQAAVFWIGLSTPALAAKYRKMTDATYSGLCYASGRSGAAAWVAQVHPTGHVAADREVLRAVAPAELTSGYLAVTCPN